MIPLTSKPYQYKDVSGITYLIAQPTDEILDRLADEQSKFPDGKSLSKLFASDKTAFSRYIDMQVNIILIGWEPTDPANIPAGLVDFPADGKPAAMLPRSGKVDLVGVFNRMCGLTEIEVKN